MTREEQYIKGHPELFKDNLDKWLFKELGIMGGSCASQNVAEYLTAREVGEKLQQAMIDKACEWLKENLTNNPSGKLCASHYGTITKGELINEFRKAMEE